MNLEIMHRPSYALAVVKLASGESIRAQSGAMVSMSAGIRVQTQATGGIMKSLGRSLLGGESFFQNIFQAPPEGGEITLAPHLPGDIETIHMTGESWMIQSGSFLASDPGISLDTRISLKTFFAAEGLSILEASSQGTLLVSSYGAIFERQLAQGESYIVDTSHLVAFESRLQMETRTVGGLKSTLASGEGLVVQLTGPGRFLIQSRSPQAFIQWLIPHIPISKE